MSEQPAKAPGGERGPRRFPTELEMAEELAAEAAGELPELVEEEANPTARLLLTDVDMLCNYCGESPCYKKCRNCKLTKYCCKSCQTGDWRAHRGTCRTPEERLKLKSHAPLLVCCNLKCKFSFGATELSQREWRTQKQCSRCKNAFYCSAECQKHEWSTHREVCCKLEPLVPPPEAFGASSSAHVVQSCTRLFISESSTAKSGAEIDLSKLFKVGKALGKVEIAAGEPTGVVAATRALDRQLAAEGISSVLLVFLQPFTHRARSAKFEPNFFEVLRSDACVVQLTLSPSDAVVVDTALLCKLSNVVVDYMYAEEDRLTKARYSTHHMGHGSLRVGGPVPPGMAARAGWKVDQRGNYLGTGDAWNMCNIPGISQDDLLKQLSRSMPDALRSKGMGEEDILKAVASFTNPTANLTPEGRVMCPDGMAYFGPGTFTPFRWETDGLFKIGEVAKEDWGIGSIEAFVPLHMPKGQVVVRTTFII